MPEHRRRPALQAGPECHEDSAHHSASSLPRDLLAAGRPACTPAPTNTNLTAHHAGQPLQDEVLRLYTTRPDLRVLFELMTDFDEGFQEWRYRHIKLVERSIGSMRGTGEARLPVDIIIARRQPHQFGRSRPSTNAKSP